MPLNVRAKGVSLSAATNWAFNWIVGEVTPYLQEKIEWRLYPMHGFFCICSFVLVYFCESPPSIVVCYLYRMFLYSFSLPSSPSNATQRVFAPQCIQKRRACLLKRWMLFSAKVRWGYIGRSEINRASFFIDVYT